MAWWRILPRQQRSDGSWHVGAAARPPAEEGDIFRTAVCIRALKVYGPPGRGPEMTARVAKARQWLQAAKPVTTEDRNMQLMGLYWAGAGSSVLKPLAKAILAATAARWRLGAACRSCDGRLCHRRIALRTGDDGADSAHPARRGSAARKYLLNTQRADGSWFVASHSPRIQAYFDGGFPYGHDQWISNWGTSWAALALTAEIDAPFRATSQRRNTRLSAEQIRSLDPVAAYDRIAPVIRNSFG